MSSNENPSPKTDLNPGTIDKSNVPSPFPIGIPPPPATPPPPSIPKSSVGASHQSNPLQFKLPDSFAFGFKDGDLRDKWNDKEENLSDYFNYGMNEDIYRLYYKKMKNLSEIMSNLHEEYKQDNDEGDDPSDKMITVHKAKGEESEDIKVLRPTPSENLNTSLGVELGGVGSVMFPKLIKDELLVQLNLNAEKFWLKHMSMEPSDLFKMVIIQAHMEGNNQGYKYYNENSIIDMILEQEKNLLTYYKKNYKGDLGELEKVWEIGKIRKDDLKLYKGKQYMGVDSQFNHRPKEWDRVKFGNDKGPRNEEKWGSRAQQKKRNVNIYKNYGEHRRRNSMSGERREESGRNDNKAEKRYRKRNRRDEYWDDYRSRGKHSSSTRRRERDDQYNERRREEKRKKKRQKEEEKG
jgi:hypothetical protein